MRQTTLQLNLEGKAPRVALQAKTRRQLVELMARAIVAVHYEGTGTEAKESSVQVAKPEGVDSDW